MSPSSDRTLEEDKLREKEHFLSVVNAFRNYSGDSKSRLARVRSNLKTGVSLEQRDLLEKHGYIRSLDALEARIERNALLVAEILGDVGSVFENDDGFLPNPTNEETPTSPANIEKVQSTLRMFVRDWSLDGAEERAMCYEPILSELNSLYPSETRSGVKVLVPGAGLGRLAFEIARMGFHSEGNEFSLFMLFASNFVLNKCKFIECFQVYPWIHSFCNNLSQEDMIRPVRFPDIDPNSLAEDAQFSMIAGDFLEVYGKDPSYANSFDSVVSCFFLDCAHNILDFIQVINKVLKSGGVWINFGPLLYHYSDVPGEISIEPSYDVVHSLIEDSGFTFSKETKGMEVSYNQNPNSMLQYKYNCVSFTCIKK